MTTRTAPTSTVIAARVPAPLAVELREHADRYGVTMSHIIGRSVERALRPAVTVEHHQVGGVSR